MRRGEGRVQLRTIPLSRYWRLFEFWAHQSTWLEQYTYESNPFNNFFMFMVSRAHAGR